MGKLCLTIKSANVVALDQKMLIYKSKLRYFDHRALNQQTF
jgi:hypothetical protein